MSLHHTLEQYYPQLYQNPKGKITIKNLLTHSSGIKSYHRFYLEKQYSDREDVIQGIIDMDLEFNPGNQFSYSDLGMILLMEIAEKVSSKSLEKMSSAWFYRPLGMNSTMYNPQDDFLPQIVPTEYDTLYRNKLIHGIVHDEYTFLIGGISSQAGLFSTAENLAKYAQMYINEGTWLGKRIIKESFLKEFTSKQFLPKESDYALGWDTPSKNGKSSAGDYFSDTSF